MTFGQPKLKVFEILNPFPTVTLGSYLLKESVIMIVNPSPTAQANPSLYAEELVAAKGCYEILAGGYRWVRAHNPG